MLKEIGKLILHETINGKDMPTEVNIFDNTEIEVIRKAQGSSVTVYRDSADKFLMNCHFMTQFVNSNKVEEALKEWRK